MKKGKEVKLEGRDPYASQKEKESVRSLKEQLEEHNRLLEGKEVIGYSILFSQEESTGENISTDDSPAKGANVVSHGMATTYPDVFNHLLLGFHTKLLSGEEMAILEIIGATVSGRIVKLQKEADGKEMEIEDSSGPRKIF